MDAIPTQPRKAHPSAYLSDTNEGYSIELLNGFLEVRDLKKPIRHDMPRLLAGVELNDSVALGEFIIALQKHREILIDEQGGR